MGLLETAYSALVALHISFYSLFIGGWVTVMAWKVLADRSGEAGYIARAHRGIAAAEAKLLIPAGFLGFFLGYIPRRIPIGAPFGGMRITASAWTTYGMLLWFAGMAAWWFGMRRVEDRLILTAEAVREGGGELGEGYARTSLLWFLFAALAILAPVAGVFVMVFRVGWGFTPLWLGLFVVFVLAMALFGYTYPAAHAETGGAGEGDG